MEALETTKYNLKAQSIIESAVFNFNRNGFYGTSLEHITRSLNMTDKSIYYYFKNKEDLFGRDYKYETIRIDNSYPSFIFKNQNKLKEFIYNE